MRIRGALHVHSQLSHDGALSIAELAEWYRSHSYRFVALGEHSQDMNEAKVRALVERSAEISSPAFCVIPGIEFACKGGLHIVGIGVTQLVREFAAVDVIEKIHEQGGFAVLAHPKKYAWNCPLEITLAADAAEIWNLGYDGKFLPSSQSILGFARLRRINPRLLAVAGHDFHQKAGFYDVGIEMELPCLTVESILINLREGRYSIRSLFFETDARAQFSWLERVRLLALSWQLGQVRRARDIVMRPESG